MSHLTNPLATAAQLARCRDRAAALQLPSELLDAVFFATQRLTQAAGLLLELPQSTTARANVLLARYWVQAPGFDVAASRATDYRHVSAAAVYLVAKTGPLPRSARDIANVYHYLAVAGAAEGTAGGASSDTEYAAFHTHVLACETRLLDVLAFETHVALPHPLAITYLQTLSFLGDTGPPADSALAHRAVQYLNTALLSPQLLYVTHQPHELAVAALYSAARDIGARLPDAAGPWWEVFDVDRETLGFLAVALRSVASWAAAAQQQQIAPALFASVGSGLTKKSVYAQAQRAGEE
ncbi:cyclin domain containing protein [Sporothrix brasiliensis 5110]|uniref:Cyclin domain containing protein n=1 Tax=Sporothrix brasiliensis 5110 TaxID=1398154 RepID=A0A0C2FCN3_9PEZI|nr:cyclin domain containing protein [Sporothrix brasiliensis 5110]KIH88883.1 cyclin domain containing protein [Sporothrix brasiliensis 5110]